MSAIYKTINHTSLKMYSNFYFFGKNTTFDFEQNVKILNKSLL